MDIEEWWVLIERSAHETSDQMERTTWLTQRLERMPFEEIVSFQIHLDETRRGIDTYEMWGAFTLICDGCSTDLFWYAQTWLIGEGRHWFEHVAADPDNLADVPAILSLAGRSQGEWSDDEWPWWENLNYVAHEAAEAVMGDEEGMFVAVEEAGHEIPHDPAPPGDWWSTDDPAEWVRRYPRLTRLFPPSPQLATRSGPSSSAAAATPTLGERHPYLRLAVGIIAMAWWIGAAVVLACSSPIRDTVDWVAGTAVGAGLALAATEGWIWSTHRPHFRRRRWRWWQYASSLGLIVAIVMMPPLGRGSRGGATNAYEVAALWYQAAGFTGTIVVLGQVLWRSRPVQSS
jgi:hypothetical protein